jgi:biopolymer transport protein ExbD
MTPMIDVVFQLIIFFIVTIKMEQDVNPAIELADAKDGPVIAEEDPWTVTIEIDRRGWISMRGAQFSKTKLRKLLRSHYDRYGEFPVLIRGDHRTRHQDIRAVMDMCTEVGIWRISFAAIQTDMPDRAW